MSDQVVPSSNKQIVIIGGGQAGRDTARLLVKSKNSNTSVVIIQPHTYSYSPTLMPWWLEHHKQIEGKWNTGKSTVGDIERLCIPGVKYAFGEATEVSTSAKTVTVVSNEGTAKTTNTISYDALIVATGIFYPLASPDSQYTDLEALKKLYCEELPIRIGAAKSILIGGAGPVACEMANTLRSLNQSCKITMVTSGENAIPEWTGTAASKVKGKFVRQWTYQQSHPFQQSHCFLL
jgi:NADH dehydrogenase FAD-containing subunit